LKVIQEVKPLEQDARRRFLFARCHTMEDLHRWIYVYLGIDFPYGRVDPSSNSSPMELIWEIYEAGMTGNHEWARMLSFAARDSFKTLGAGILEVLALLHMDRSVAHMAAQEGQAKKSQEYTKKFLHRPLLREFITSENERQLTVRKYHDVRTDMHFFEAELPYLPPNIRSRLELVENYIKIVICTPAGANSDHVPFMVIDEVDVVANPDAYEEAKFIASPSHDGLNPITLLTSTRKYSTGLVQKEIDNATNPESGGSGLEIRHWNLLDVTKRCLPKRHRPDLPRIPIYRSDSLLRAVNEERYLNLNPDQQAKYVKDEGYQGCLSNCKLFAACQGRLVHQKSTSPLLKKISHVISLFRNATPEKAKAQLLCWKPSKEGMIYPNLEAEVHKKSAAQMAHMLTGEDYDERTFNKVALVALAKERGCRFVSGMDHGYTHNFAVVTGFIDGNRFFVIDVISVAELEIGQKIDLCESRIKAWDPLIYPDPAEPGSRKTFIKHGFRCRDFKKGPGSVQEGIDCVRMKISPALGGDPTIFFLKDDDGVDLLFSRLSKYHWVLDDAEKPTDVPDDEDDDECDAIRYVVMNEFNARKGRIRAPDAAHQEDTLPVHQYPQDSWMKQRLAELTGQEVVHQDLESAPATTIKRGSFLWSSE
jgi:hypothetical protein